MAACEASSVATEVAPRHLNAPLSSEALNVSLVVLLPGRYLAVCIPLYWAKFTLSRGHLRPRQGAAAHTVRSAVPLACKQGWESLGPGRVVEPTTGLLFAALCSCCAVCAARGFGSVALPLGATRVALVQQRTRQAPIDSSRRQMGMPSGVEHIHDSLRGQAEAADVVSIRCSNFPPN